MKPSKPEPVWQTVLHVALTVIAVIVAVPAVMDGDWQVAVVAFLALIVVEVAVIVLVRCVQRRRGRVVRD